MGIQPGTRNPAVEGIGKKSQEAKRIERVPKSSHRRPVITNPAIDARSNLNNKIMD